MKKRSNEAERFVVISVSEKDLRETFVVQPETTVREIFDLMWPKDEFSKAVYKPPVRIELHPDRKTVPDDPDWDFGLKADESPA